MMKKVLRKMKMAENCEGSFVKENKTFYTKNEDNRNRYNNWKIYLKLKGYVRSYLNPRPIRSHLQFVFELLKKIFGNGNIDI